MSGVRREPRIAVMILVQASWQDQTGSVQTVAARMEDKSASGACIRVKKQIGVGAKLRIQYPREQFSGTARYCRSAGLDYMVGIQRDPASTSIQARPVGLVPARQEGAHGSAASPVAIPLSLPQRLTTASGEAPLAEQKPACVILSSPPPGAPSMPTPKPEFKAMLRNAPAAPPPQCFVASARPELETNPEARGKEVRTERKPMRRKWLELPHWQNKQNPLSPPGNGNGNGNGAHAKHAPTMVISEKKATAQTAASDIASFQVELVPTEDIYRAAGILNPPKGYSINKVVDMLHSEHIRGLSKELKRAAVLMALDSAGVPLDQVLQDAKARQSALDSYEAEQKKQVEAEWARKEEENAQIEAELERLRAHYMARISRNMDGVAREKATFTSWLTLKQQESHDMAEAAELCTKFDEPEPVARLLPEVSMVSAAKPE